MTSALTTIETGQLAAYERTIESGLQTFVEVGAALSAIRDSKLYRASHGTFEEYCRERWGMARTYSHYMIESAKVVENIRVHNCEHIPATESQARPLAKLPAEEQAPAWQEAVETAQAESREVTAKDVERAVSRRTTNPTTPEEEEARYLADESDDERPPDPRSGKIVMPAVDPKDDARSETANLAGLKRYWRFANKRERRDFLAWCKDN